MPFRFRTNWRGKLILQVNETLNHTDPMDMSEFTSNRWRDAKVQDLDMVKVEPIQPLVVGA